MEEHKLLAGEQAVLHELAGAEGSGSRSSAEGSGGGDGEKGAGAAGGWVRGERWVAEARGEVGGGRKGRTGQRRRDLDRGRGVGAGRDLDRLGFTRV